MNDACYHLVDVRKRLGAFTLELSSLAVQRGEVLALLGPTGAGKTTLLRLLGGLLATDAGTISLHGQTFVPPRIDIARRRRVTLVHQHPLLLDGTVRMNVAYPLRLRGERDYDDKLATVLGRLGLTEIADQAARTLSGGQTQMVALARVLVIEPDVLLLDEPTAHLDPARVALVEETIRQLRRERAMTIVWATHNLFQSRRVADRAALLLNGELVEVADTEAFFDRPRDARTADFVQGRMIY